MGLGVDRALPLRLTLLVLVLRPPGDGSLKAATWLVAGAALVFPALTLSSLTWLALTLLVAARVVFDWPLADNHIYLLAYWCLAVTLALWYDASASSEWPAHDRADDSRGSYHALLRRSSRWLIGFAFLCAVVWKAALSPDYLDGRFFRVTLSTDDRFAPLARAAGLTDDQITANRHALEPLPPGAEAIDGPVLNEPPALRRVAGVLTWGGLALEILVALGFLLRPGRVAHASLLAFCALTYAVAPVAGFGWLVAVLGLATCAETQSRLRAAYVAAFALVLLYSEAGAVGRALDALA
jgi:hypothetical protein